MRVEVVLDPKVADRITGRTSLRFHVGTAEVAARLVIEGDPNPGPRPARVTLDAAVVARAGDRFVLRSSVPRDTVGGGVIVEPLPPARVRP